MAVVQPLRQTSRLILVGFLVSALLALVCGCSDTDRDRSRSSEDGREIDDFSGQARTERQSDGAGLSLKDLKDATYDIGMEGITIDLVDGEYEEHDPESMAYMGVWLTDDLAFGDLDNNGSTDAAAVLGWTGGGSGSFFFLTAITDKNSDPINVGNQALGDRVDVKSIEISKGIVSITMLRHAPEDPMCCPTQRVTRIFHLRGHRLIELR